MTDDNKMRRIEDRLPGEPLKWEEPQIADWRPYHSALSRCAELLDNMKDGDPITDVPDFLAAKLKELGAHLASQSQAAQPSIDTPELRRFVADHIGLDITGPTYQALLSHLAGQSQATRAVPDLHNAIMNLPCNPPDGWGGIQQTGYKIGHRDARHAAAELVSEAVAAQEVTQQAAKAETAEQAEGEQANVLPPTRGTGSQQGARASAWISADEHVPSGKNCLAVYENRGGSQFIIRAMYVEKFQIEAQGDDCDTEINDENDTEYLREGWYELIDNWGEYSSVRVCEGVVTHWMPLPPTPDQVSTAGSAKGGNTNVDSSDLAPTTSTVSAPEGGAA